jgi:RNA polymerase sigma factor (sigma-70 family)
MSRSDEEDELEMKRLREKDPTALRQFWLRERPIVRGICTRVLADGSEAGEVADEVLIDFMFNYVNRLDHARTMGAYLRLMAARRAIRHRERRSKHVELAAQADDSQPDPERSILHAKAVSALEHCFRKLTPKAQEAVRLRYSADLTQQQIGAIVGGSKQYIGRVLAQSIDKLRECLRTAGFEMGATK